MGGYQGGGSKKRPLMEPQIGETISFETFFLNIIHIKVKVMKGCQTNARNSGPKEFDSYFLQPSYSVQATYKP